MTLPDWRGRTVVCIASGPSLTAEDCETARASGLPVVVTNTTFRLCPWADALFGFDPQWWRMHLAEIRRDFRGQCYTQSLAAMRGVICARVSHRFRSFSNAGTDAIALSIAAGSRRILMLGYDCSIGAQTHHHGDHPPGLRNCDTLPLWPARFARLAVWAMNRGAIVLNASRSSALTCFPRVEFSRGLLDGSEDVGGRDGGCLGVGAEYVAGNCGLGQASSTDCGESHV